MLTDGLECCGLLWCFYQTLILTAPIHCRASIAETLMQRHISTNLMKTRTHPDLGWPEGEGILIFGVELFYKRVFCVNREDWWTVFMKVWRRFGGPFLLSVVLSSFSVLTAGSCITITQHYYLCVLMFSHWAPADALRCK